MTKVILNLDENVAGALCYLFGFITGLIFYLLENQNKFVKFHAMQSLITFLGVFIVLMVIWWVPFFGWILRSIIILLALILWVILMVKAYYGEKFKLPIIGDIAEQYS